MSTSAVLTILSLFTAYALVQAQVTAPNCTVSSLGWVRPNQFVSLSFTDRWSWSFNSIGQNPCTVAAFLQSTCYQGSFAIGPLPQGYEYAGPDAHENTTCKCSTVVYSLLSACDACQGSGWFRWYDYSTNCTTGEPSASSFVNPVPQGTRVPYWALIDVTVQGTWNSSQSYAVGGRNASFSVTQPHSSSTLPFSDRPEVPPGAIINSGTWK
ncbi:hypothetical protein BGW80DRAFT_375961 [Lactifluus volemus]|nr:hypothetical protein BGW80DRAFT_375961 [Lactifluus volemus]